MLFKNLLRHLHQRRGDDCVGLRFQHVADRAYSLTRDKQLDAAVEPVRAVRTIMKDGVGMMRGCVCKIQIGYDTARTSSS